MLTPQTHPPLSGWYNSLLYARRMYMRLIWLYTCREDVFMKLYWLPTFCQMRQKAGAYIREAHTEAHLEGSIKPVVSQQQSLLGSVALWHCGGCWRGSGGGNSNTAHASHPPSQYTIFTLSAIAIVGRCSPVISTWQSGFSAPTVASAKPGDYTWRQKMATCWSLKWRRNGS